VKLCFVDYPPGVLTSLQKWQLHRIASITERLSIEINVTEDHLESRTFEINPGHRDIILKNGTNGHPSICRLLVQQNHGSVCSCLVWDNRQSGWGKSC
jgi:hypothetical protein